MRYREEGRVNPGSEQVGTRQFLSDSDVQAVRAFLRLLRGNQASYSITADQNNFRLSRATIQRFTTDASRTITGFFANDFDNNLKVIVNVGAQDLVLADQDVASDETNRIICHTTPADITLGPNQSVLIFYDRTSARIRTVGF